MELDLEPLLDELWSCASSDPLELEMKVRSCLKDYATESFLAKVALLIAHNQYSIARALVDDFLHNHHAVYAIQRRVELILHFKKHRTLKTKAVQTTLRSKETLINNVNGLVASGELSDAEDFLLKAIELTDDPDYLNLLSRVLMLQNRPMEGAEALQRALIVTRKIKSFSVLSDDIDELPTFSDLAFIQDSTESLGLLKDQTTPDNIAEACKGNDSFSFMPQIALEHAALKCDMSESPHSLGLTQFKESACSSSSAFDEDCEAFLKPQAGPLERNNINENTILPSEATKTILKLTRPRTTLNSLEGSGHVKVFNKSGRLLNRVHSTEINTFTVDADMPESNFASPPLETFPSEPTHHIEDEDETFELELQDYSPAENEFDFDYGHDELDSSADFNYDFELDSEPGSAHILDDFEDDYAAYVFDPDEVFSPDELEGKNPNENFSDKLSREDRALQKASELIGKTNWPLSALPLIQQIFVMSGWGATRLALEREIVKGLTPDELILATHLKIIWSENDTYWISFDKNGSTRLSYYVLSWPAALLIVRSFESLPQIEEIEVFLENLFSSWIENTVLRRAFKAFARYLWFRFANLEGCLPASQHFDFCDPRELPAEEYSDLGLCDELGIERTNNLREYGVLQVKHPQEPGCYFSDKPRVEKGPLLNIEKASNKNRPDDAEVYNFLDTEDESIADVETYEY